MTPSRRTLLGGLIATLAAPAIIRTPGLLMPVRVPFEDYWTRFHRDAVAALNEYDRVNPFKSYFAGAYIKNRPHIDMHIPLGVLGGLTIAEFAASGRTA